MNIDISYSKRSLKFLKSNENLINEEQTDELLIRAVKKIIMKEEINIDLKKMKGVSINLYRVRKGKVRIIFSITKVNGIEVNVNDIGFRGDVYN